jgi:UDP-N-acetylglucosamine--N-acetylmuramyl-(pentapeptide) pyrophosphoryl-undecaprenol N-acetylglucosamine transferase
MRLLITGGGTGGHVYPLLAVLQSLAADRALDLKRDVCYVGREGSIEQRVAAQGEVPFAALDVRGLRTTSPWSFVGSLVLMLGALSQCRNIFNNFKPQVVLATGGYVSAPAVWTAALTRTPVIVYLPDLEPGWAIRTLSRWARKVAVSFHEVVRFFPPGKAVVTGYPVRASFYHATKFESCEHFRLNPSQHVITVFGGSQGAHSINEAVHENLTHLLQTAQVLHISGHQDEAVLQSHRATLTGAENAKYHLFSYLDLEMPMALAAADVVIARAGAATLGEFPAVGVPGILVPYPFAGRHQERNAGFLTSRGAAIMIQDENLSRELVPSVAGLLSDKARLLRMGAAMRGLAQPDAAKNIAKLLTQVAM